MGGGGHGIEQTKRRNKPFWGDGGGGGGGGDIRAHRELPILVQLQCHPFLHLLARNCFLLFVA